MKSRILLIAMASLLSVNVLADTVGFRIGGGAWDHEASGTFRDTGTVNIDLKNDLGFSSNKEGYGYIVLEHPIPVLPNVRFASTKMGHTGTGTVTVTFDGQTFTNEPVSSILTFDSTDITLYYEILDNVVGFDLGLTARSVEGRVNITSTTTPSLTGDAPFDETIPMIYFSLGVELPLTGLSFEVGGNIIAFDGNEYSDYMLKVSYETEFLLGIEAGIRQQKLVLDNVDTLFADMTFDGVFLGLFLHF